MDFISEVSNLFHEEAGRQSNNRKNHDSFLSEVDRIVEENVLPVFEAVKQTGRLPQPVAKIEVGVEKTQEGDVEGRNVALDIDHHSGEKDSLVFKFDGGTKTCVREWSFSNGETEKETPMPAKEMTKEVIERVTLQFLNKVFHSNKARVGLKFSSAKIISKKPFGTGQGSA